MTVQALPVLAYFANAQALGEAVGEVVGVAESSAGCVPWSLGHSRDQSLGSTTMSTCTGL